jgi:hypothetical protein
VSSKGAVAPGRETVGSRPTSKSGEFRAGGDMNTMRRAAAALVLAGVALAGCAGPTGDAATPAGSVAASAAPSAAPTGSTHPLPPGALPSGAPKTPSDLVRPAGWIEGTVVRGGSGPCYGVLDLDGVEYAMYTVTGGELAKGTRIMAKIAPARLQIDCGSGQQVMASAIERLP